MGQTTIDNFVVATRAQIQPYINQRAGETKLGEVLHLPDGADWLDELRSHPAKFVLLGIPEDIGVRANGGVGGAHTLWEPALRGILNVQHTPGLNGNDMLLAGHFDFAMQMAAAENADESGLRELVAEIDNAVAPLIEGIAAGGKVPVIIGGGHNNAYPIIKGCAMASGRPVNTLNLDAHADFRALEGRHSGNGFSYAMHEKYLSKYAAVGLHRNYNNAAMAEALEQNPDCVVTWFDDIFLEETVTFKEAVADAVAFVFEQPFGVELDMDCITGMLSSAATPSGIEPLLARQYVNWCAQAKPVYLHICEGATALRNGRQDMQTAKLAAYLVTDFIRSYTA